MKIRMKTRMPNNKKKIMKKRENKMRTIMINQNKMAKKARKKIKNRTKANDLF